MQKYSHIIWDWNGTLFNDVAWCIQVINTMLKKRGIKTLENIAEYHNVFGFPIVEYYKNVGLDMESERFEDLAVEWLEYYHSNNSGGCGLYPGAAAVLEAVSKSGISQVILSASEQNNLMSQVREFDITKYFDEILGISDIYAKSKVAVGLDYIARSSVNNAILVGDTKHDYEVTKALGIDCVLIPNGHQSKNMLLLQGVPVLDDITCVIEYIVKQP